MLRFLVGVAAVAITASSGLSLYDRAAAYMTRENAARVAMAERSAEASAELRKAEGLRVCDQPYWEYRRGKAADSVAPARMVELKRIITDCNAKYGTDFSL